MPTICLFISLAVCQTSADATPRNIVLIMADDVGYECFGCYGSTQYATPRIDQLAARGMRFTHCYSQPLCTPTRVKLMTGLSNVRNYSAFSILRRDQTTIGHRFQQAGYRTMIAGKWQLLAAEHYDRSFRKKGSWPLAAGFDRCCLWQVNQLGRRYWGPLLNIDGRNQSFDDAHYGPDVCTQAVLDFMSEPSDRPFLIYYPMILVHDPFLPTPASTSRRSKNQQANFEDMVSYMDTLVGRIVDQLHQQGLAENTLLLFTSDNGTHRRLQSQLAGRTIQGGKGQTDDAGTRVPLVAYCPGTVPKGRTCDDLIDFSDLLPTLLSIPNASIPSHLDGVSFWPQLRGLTGRARQWMYCYYCPRPERHTPIAFVRDQRWKLYDDGRFYDVSRDTLEGASLSFDQLDEDARRAHHKLTDALRSMPDESQSLLQY